MLDAGRAFPDHGIVASVVTGGLGCLADEVPANRDSIGQRGGMEYAMEAWDRHPDNTGVLFGVGAQFAGTSYDHVENKRRIVFGTDFVRKGFAAMRRFPKSDDP